MGRMDVSALRYLSRDEMRTLQAVEQGMKNHELVPVELISSIANLKHGGAFKCLSSLLRSKLIKHDRKHYDGYSLNYLGYDYLAFSTLSKRNIVRAVGRQIGVGKESDVFIALDDSEEREVVVKMHRLGRTSFRKIKEKRDYHQHRKFANWLYLSRLAAQKEFAFMRVLRDAGFPVPEPIDQNRHCVVMSLVDAYPLTQIKHLRNPGKVFAKLMELHIRLAQCGLVHCDFNEFNVMISDGEDITVIDFPQMVSTSHANAAFYFNRDVECLRVFFERRFGFQASSIPSLADCGVRVMDLDKLVAASGFSREETNMFDEAMESYRQKSAHDDMDAGEDRSSGEEEEEEEGQAVEEEGGDKEERAYSDVAEDGTRQTEKISFGGSEFQKLQAADGEDGEDGAVEETGEGDGKNMPELASIDAQSEGEEAEEAEGAEQGKEQESVMRPANGAAESQYDRDNDIRRAWRFSGKPSTSKSKGNQDVKSRAAKNGEGADWKRKARNRVKDRDRHKVMTQIKESL